MIDDIERRNVEGPPEMRPRQDACAIRSIVVSNVRLLEIPMPRRSTYDAAFFGVELPKDVEPTHQERA